MKKINKNLLKSLEKVVRVTSSYTSTDWPPICSSWLHQPKRPQMKKK